MQNLNNIKNKLIEKNEFIRFNFNIKEIGIFGSYVRNENTEKSDIDILIDYDKKAKFTLFDLIKLENYLTELLGIKVDIALKNKLKTALEKNILEEVIYI